MALLVFAPVVVSCLCNLLADFLDKRRAAADPAEAALAAQVRSLNQEIAKLSPVADFVAVSLKQREVGKLEKALAAKSAARKNEVASRPDVGRIIRWGILPLLQLALLLLYWGQSVALLPSGWFAWLLFFQESPGRVGVVAWLTVVSVAVGGATAQLSQLIGLKAPATQSGAGGVLSSLISKIL